MTDLRDEISKAFDASEAAPPPEPPAETTAEPEAGAEPAAEEAEPVEAETTEEPAESSGRDERGRFKKGAAEPAAKPAAVAAPKPGEAAKPVTAAPVVAAPALRPPTSWKPVAREHWTKLPPQVQQEIVRVDREVARTMNESASLRKQQEAFNRTVAPYAHVLQAEGLEPLQAVDTVFKMVNRLRVGTPQEKAQIVAHLTKSYGVDVEQLANALDGHAAAAAPQQQFRDPRVDQLLSTIETGKREREQALREEGRQAWEDFVGSHEFAEDVKADMAYVMESRGDISEEDAYNLAIKLFHPEIQGVLDQRDEAKRAATPNGATQRKRAASVSVRSAPTTQVRRDEDADSLRATIEQAFDENG